MKTEKTTALMQTDEKNLRLKKLFQFASIPPSVYINVQALMQTEGNWRRWRECFSP
jgi:hypothetical protein